MLSKVFNVFQNLGKTHYQKTGERFYVELKGVIPESLTPDDVSEGISRVIDDIGFTIGTNTVFSPEGFKIRIYDEDRYALNEFKRELLLYLEEAGIFKTKPAAGIERDIFHPNQA